MPPNQTKGLLVKQIKKAWDARQPSGILCHRFKFIYFPVPKAANTSVRMMIAEVEGLSNDGQPAHALPFEYVRASELGKYPDYRRLVVVRNPWSRLLSCYTGKICWEHRWNGEIVRRTEITAGFARYNRLFRRRLFHTDMTFGEFARIVARIPDCFSDRHFRSQYKAFCHRDGTPLAGYIVRMEHLQEEMQSFLSSVGANDIEIKHLNGSRRSNDAEQYDDELTDIVARRYRRDIELLRYTGPQLDCSHQLHPARNRKIQGSASPALG